MGKLEAAVANYDLTSAIEHASNDILRKFLDSKEQELQKGQRFIGQMNKNDYFRDFMR